MIPIPLVCKDASHRTFADYRFLSEPPACASARLRLHPLRIMSTSNELQHLQFTSPRSEASIIFGKGVTSAKSGSAELVLAVDDVDAARNDLIARGVDVSEVFHYAGGPFKNAMENPRVAGGDPEGRSYFSFASFEDPDGNRWLLQEINERLPGREWK